jgi:hypothetical protein
VVSTVRLSPPDIVIDSLAPGKLPSFACIAARRFTIAWVSPSPGAAFSRALAARATRYGSRDSRPERFCTASSLSRPFRRWASDSAQTMYALVVSYEARPKLSSAFGFFWKPPLPSRRDMSHAAVRSIMARSTPSSTFAMSSNSMIP